MTNKGEISGYKSGASDFFNMEICENCEKETETLYKVGKTWTCFECYEELSEEEI